MKTDTNFRKILVLAMLLSVLLLSLSASAEDEVTYYKPITEINLGIRELTLEVGEQYTLPLTYIPEETPNVFLDWYTDETTIRVDPEHYTVTALAPGKTRLLVESEFGFTYDYCDITVTGSVAKGFPEKMNGSEMVILSREDRNKIKAETVLHFLDFIENSSFTASDFAALTERKFNVTAEVRPGTVTAESRRAASLGMEKALELPDLDAVSLYGTFSQILAFVKDNDDLNLIFEFRPMYIEDPVMDDDNGPVANGMNLKDNVEALTSVSTAHNLGLTGAGSVVAIIDTGLDRDHEQFSGRVIGEYCAALEYNDAYPSCYEGSAEPSRSKEPSLHNHGSHVAGIAAGRDGIAPGAKIVAINISVERCSGNSCRQSLYVDEYEVAQYLVNLQKDYKSSGQPQIVAANMSYSTRIGYSGICDSDQPYKKKAIDLLLENNIIPVTTTGNDSNEGTINPSSCLSTSFAVGALFDQSSPVIAPYSNHGQLVDILAPGTTIWSSFYAYESGTRSTCENLSSNLNCYGYYSGTSMAAPMVTGAFALLKQDYPNLTATQLESVIKELSTKTANYRPEGNNRAVTFSYSKPVLDFSRLDDKPKTSSLKILTASGTDVTGKSLTVGSRVHQFKAVVSPISASEKYYWVTSNTDIASVDQSGKLTFSAGGSVYVYAYATDGSGIYAWVQITYNPKTTSVKIYTSSGTDVTGKTLTVSSPSHQLKAVAGPVGVSQRFTWKTSNTSIATVDSTGKLTFRARGSVYVYAYATDGSGKYGRVKITYNPKTTSVMIYTASGTNVTGKTLTVSSPSHQLKAVAGPVGVSQKFTWKTSNTSIATVDSTGKLTFRARGSVYVYAYATDGSGKYGRVKITYSPKVTSVKIYTASGTDVTGKTLTVSSPSHQLKAVAGPVGVSQKFTWRSSSTATATVDSTGKVVFRKTGTVTVTATAADGSGKSAWVKITYVAKAPVLEIKDSNIRGKNKEIQVVIPWTSGLTRVAWKLYDNETDKLVTPKYRERMDTTGKNKIISWVGDPLVNGHVYRMEIRVFNGKWSNTVKKYGMPIPNAYGATVVAGNRTMVINTKHREPCSGTRYMIFDAATEKEIAYRTGTRNDTSWTYGSLTNGKLYYAVAVPYRDYRGQRLWGPNENRIYFIPMTVPTNGSVIFNSSSATVSIDRDSTATGIRVLYRSASGKLVNGCEGSGYRCTINNLNVDSVDEFYVLKYKTANKKKYYSMGLLLRDDDISGLSRPQMNPTVAMNNSGYTTFTIKRSSNATGISVLYRVGEGAFQQACEAAGNSCSTTLDVKKNYTFYIMQYRTVSGKKVYSPGIVARDFSSGR